MKVTTADVEDQSILDWIWGTKPKVNIVDTCMPAFMPLDKNSQFGPVFILGMPFLRYYKTTFVRSDPPQMYFDRVDKFCDPLDDDAVEAAEAPSTVAGKAERGTDILPSALNQAGSKVNSRFGRFYDADDFKPEPIDLNNIIRPKWARR